VWFLNSLLFALTIVKSPRQLPNPGYQLVVRSHIVPNDFLSAWGPNIMSHKHNPTSIDSHPFVRKLIFLASLETTKRELIEKSQRHYRKVPEILNSTAILGSRSFLLCSSGTIVDKRY
jgi:hypothetical protein